MFALIIAVVRGFRNTFRVEILDDLVYTLRKKQRQELSRYHRLWEDIAQIQIVTSLAAIVFVVLELPIRGIVVDLEQIDRDPWSWMNEEW